MVIGRDSNMECTPLSLSDDCHRNWNPGTRSTCDHYNAVGMSSDPH